MTKKISPQDFDSQHLPTWCPGCGNFVILQALKMALSELDISPHKTVLTYGIGCAGNMANNIKGYVFHSLHGRSLPVAVGAKMANHKLTVIAVSGDGDTYGEGTNHLLHAARENIDIIHIVANNHSYSLTTGQASPTSTKGYVTQTTPWGEVKEPLNPLSVVLAADASFVARSATHDLNHLKEMIKAGLQHKGYAHLDVWQDCVTWNKTQDLQYFKEHSYNLADINHDVSNKQAAFQKAEEEDKLPLGIFFKKIRPTYTATFPQLKKEALVDKKISQKTIQELAKL
jgi:2-oxoglutarate/2-oxoacid ferredoxin oxidoreductase subunit beta